MSSACGQMSVYNQTRKTTLAWRVRVADGFLSRMIGLLGKPSMPAGSGLWIVPGNSIHTVGMLFPIDVVLMDRNARVVGLRERVAPFSILWPNVRAKSVLELPAQTISATSTRLGDQLQIVANFARVAGAMPA
jgi:uncharacterized protein